MSMRKCENVRCACGREFESELWNAINVTDDPELKELVIAGEVNIVCCPACNALFYAEQFILYQDSANEILAFVYPSEFEKDAGHWRARMQADFKQAMDALAIEERIPYQPLLLFGLDALVDLINRDEDENDEVAILIHVHTEVGVRLIHLHPALTRDRQLVKVLPYVPLSGVSLRAQVMAGLEKLIAYNDHLARYKENLALLRGNQRWTLDASAIASMK